MFVGKDFVKSGDVIGYCLYVVDLKALKYDHFAQREDLVEAMHEVEVFGIT